MLLRGLLISVGIGAIPASSAHPSAPDEPCCHRLVCLVPLAAIAGAGVIWASTLG